MARGVRGRDRRDLVIKCRRALAQTGSGNAWSSPAASARTASCARNLPQAGEREGFRVYFPRLEFCTDNGAMIALAGALRLQAGLHDGLAIKVSPRWDLESLPAV